MLNIDRAGILVRDPRTEHAEWRAERQASLPTLAELVGQLAALTPDFTKNEALR